MHNPLLADEIYPTKSNASAGCGGTHWRKDCPHLKSRCREYGKIGHISKACRNRTITDSAGVRRMVAQPKQTGVIVETAIDNTTPAPLKTVAEVVDKLISTRDKDKIRANNKYAQQKMEKFGKNVKSTPERPVMLMERVENWTRSLKRKYKLANDIVQFVSECLFSVPSVLLTSVAF